MVDDLIVKGAEEPCKSLACIVHSHGAYLPGIPRLRPDVHQPLRVSNEREE